MLFESSNPPPPCETHTRCSYEAKRDYPLSLTPSVEATTSSPGFVIFPSSGKVLRFITSNNKPLSLPSVPSTINPHYHPNANPPIHKSHCLREDSDLACEASLTLPALLDSAADCRKSSPSTHSTSDDRHSIPSDIHRNVVLHFPRNIGAHHPYLLRDASSFIWET